MQSLRDWRSSLRACFADEEDSHTTACWELYTLEHGLSVGSSTSQCYITLVCLADCPVPCLRPSSHSPRTRLHFALLFLASSLNKTRANPHLEIHTYSLMEELKPRTARMTMGMSAIVLFLSGSTAGVVCSRSLLFDVRIV